MPLVVCCTVALTSLSDSESYMTFLFSEWRIDNVVSKLRPKKKPHGIMRVDSGHKFSENSS